MSSLTRNIGVAKKNLLEVIFVTSYAHVSVYSADECWIYVEEEEEAADLYILNHVNKGDLVVTQNFGLAATFLPKVISVLSPKRNFVQRKRHEYSS